DIVFASLTLVTTQGQRLAGEQNAANPAAGALVAALRVVAAETGIAAAAIDLPHDWGQREAEWLCRETPHVAQVASIADRNGRRWQQELTPGPLPAAGGPVQRDGGVYLITGGFGGLGLALAQHLATRPVKL